MAYTGLTIVIAKSTRGVTEGKIQMTINDVRKETEMKQIYQTQIKYDICLANKTIL